jgi:hypothetical protein
LSNNNSNSGSIYKAQVIKLSSHYKREYILCQSRLPPRYKQSISTVRESTMSSNNQIAGESAHMYFRGKRQSVGIDDSKKLKTQGTDILFIEKEVIAEQLSDLAAFYGIALVHGRGFMTEYATELAVAANTTTTTNTDRQGGLDLQYEQL